jgi:hypothetical protein
MIAYDEFRWEQLVIGKIEEKSIAPFDRKTHPQVLMHDLF